jgi:hypothetical protein
MRIDLPRRRRRASLSLEAIMLIPVVMIVILTSRYIAEGMLTRQEVAVFTRASTVSAATSSLPRIVSCNADRTDFDARPAVLRTVGADCTSHPAERGLRRERPFFEALEDGARPSLGILRDVARSPRLTDVKGTGTGTFLMDDPSFLQRSGTVTSRQTYLMPEMRFWDHRTQPYSNGHDRAIWQELSQFGTAQLFPRVFPAARR